MPAIFPRATVAFVPREQFSTTQRCLETLLERTKEPFDLVVVDGGSPSEVRDYLREASVHHGFTLVRTEEYLTPNQARNLAISHVRTEHVVFVDNDVLVSDGWLKPLVDRAEQTGAWVVAPLYFEFEPEGKRIHMFGGNVDIKTDEHGDMTYVEVHRHAHVLVEDIEVAFRAEPTDLVEFHSVLIRMKTFDVLGPLDEGFLSNSEHGDLCLSVRNAGGSIWLEPASQITYAPPKSLSGADREFFLAPMERSSRAVQPFVTWPANTVSIRNHEECADQHGGCHNIAATACRGFTDGNVGWAKHSDRDLKKVWSHRWRHFGTAISFRSATYGRLTPPTVSVTTPDAVEKCNVAA